MLRIQFQYAGGTLYVGTRDYSKKIIYPPIQVPEIGYFWSGLCEICHSNSHVNHELMSTGLINIRSAKRRRRAQIVYCHNCYDNNFVRTRDFSGIPQDCAINVAG